MQFFRVEAIKLRRGSPGYSQCGDDLDFDLRAAGSLVTGMVERAGNGSGNNFPYTAFIAANWPRSTKNTVLFTT